MPLHHEATSTSSSIIVILTIVNTFYYYYYYTTILTSSTNHHQQRYLTVSYMIYSEVPHRMVYTVRYLTLYYIRYREVPHSIYTTFISNLYTSRHDRCSWGLIPADDPACHQAMILIEIMMHGALSFLFLLHILILISYI